MRNIALTIASVVTFILSVTVLFAEGVSLSPPAPDLHKEHHVGQLPSSLIVSGEQWYVGSLNHLVTSSTTTESAAYLLPSAGFEQSAIVNSPEGVVYSWSHEHLTLYIWKDGGSMGSVNIPQNPLYADLLAVTHEVAYFASTPLSSPDVWWHNLTSQVSGAVTLDAPVIQLVSDGDGKNVFALTSVGTVYKLNNGQIAGQNAMDGATQIGLVPAGVATQLYGLTQTGVHFLDTSTMAVEGSATTPSAPSNAFVPEGGTRLFVSADTDIWAITPQTGAAELLFTGSEIISSFAVDGLDLYLITNQGEVLFHNEGNGTAVVDVDRPLRIEAYRDGVLILGSNSLHFVDEGESTNAIPALPYLNKARYSRGISSTVMVAADVSQSLWRYGMESSLATATSGYPQRVAEDSTHYYIMQFSDNGYEFVAINKESGAEERPMTGHTIMAFFDDGEVSNESSGVWLISRDVSDQTIATHIIKGTIAHQLNYGVWDISEIAVYGDCAYISLGHRVDVVCLGEIISNQATILPAPAHLVSASQDGAYIIGIDGSVRFVPASGGEPIIASVDEWYTDLLPNTAYSGREGVVFSTHQNTLDLWRVSTGNLGKSTLPTSGQPQSVSHWDDVWGVVFPNEVQFFLADGDLVGSQQLPCTGVDSISTPEAFYALCSYEADYMRISPTVLEDNYSTFLPIIHK